MRRVTSEQFKVTTVGTEQPRVNPQCLCKLYQEVITTCLDITQNWKCLCISYRASYLERQAFPEEMVGNKKRP